MSINKTMFVILKKNKPMITYCFIVISIEPIMANRSIMDVNINHKG